MRKLVVTKKTGFDVKDIYKPIIIRDDRMILFYSTEDLVPKVKKFNLPKGTYFVDTGFFVPASKPAGFKLLKLPPVQRIFMPYVNGFDIHIEDNPHKCSIDWENREILMDPDIAEKPWPYIDYVISHEFGHKFYEGQKIVNGKVKNDGEHAADKFAYNRMIKLGYNPSQILYAQLATLSDNQNDRKEDLVNSVEQLYND